MVQLKGAVVLVNVAVSLKKENRFNSPTGMSPLSAGPFFSYTTGYTPTEIAQSLEDIDTFVQENGPFTGVLGFSQGASMAVAYIMDQQRRHDDRPPPFEFAILCSSVAVFSPAEEFCEDIIDALLRPDRDTHPSSQINLEEEEAKQTLAKFFSLTFEVARKIGAVPDDCNIDLIAQARSDDVPRVVHPSLTAERVCMPTVHIIGRRDLSAMVEQSKIVFQLCTEPMARIYRHQGGHGLPLNTADAKAAARLVEWAAEEGIRQRVLSQL